LNHPYTDFSNVERFVDQNGADVRHVRGLGWMTWDGTRWILDAEDSVREFAKSTLRSVMAEAERVAHINPDAVRFARRCQSAQAVTTLLQLAQSDPRLAVEVGQLDQQPWLLNTMSGTIDLRTGEMKPAAREHYITKLAPVHFDPSASSELWQRFLDDITGGDEDMQSFLRVLTGYCLTGRTDEEKLFILYGPGGTGKTTFIEAIKAVLGDYAMTADFDTFLRKQRNGIRNDIARLAGARMVTASEVQRGATLDEQVVKQITGGDRVTSRLLFKEAFEFTPTFRVLLVANHLPTVDADDSGMWRRLIPIPFDKVIGQQDATVKRTLCDVSTSGAAVLAWAVSGAVAWHRDGLALPTRIEAARAEYRSDVDEVADFIEDQCVVGATRVRRGDLHRAYLTWHKGLPGRPLTKTDFFANIASRGYRKVKSNGAWYFEGIEPKLNLTTGRLGNSYGPRSRKRYHDTSLY
jgi:putative DNA primase/helicase